MKYFSLTMLALCLLGAVLGSCGKTTQIPGPKGEVGATGEDGQNGAQGPVGPSGAPGLDATQITVVQLCTSCVPSYPSVFAEIGFCFGGNLYGTYSANGGFSTLLTPGAYSSNGINCSCTFTVGPNCTVTQ